MCGSLALLCTSGLQDGARAGLLCTSRCLSRPDQCSLAACRWRRRRYKLHFVHIVWVDGTLNMVKVI